MIKSNTNALFRQYGKNADEHWHEVMELAKKYGFIMQEYNGTALLLTHCIQLSNFSELEYLRVQQMNGHCPKECGYDGDLCVSVPRNTE